MALKTTDDGRYDPAKKKTKPLIEVATEEVLTEIRKVKISTRPQGFRFSVEYTNTLAGVANGGIFLLTNGSIRLPYPAILKMIGLTGWVQRPGSGYFVLDPNTMNIALRGFDNVSGNEANPGFDDITTLFPYGGAQTLVNNPAFRTSGIVSLKDLTPLGLVFEYFDGEVIASTVAMAAADVLHMCATLFFERLDQ